MAIANWLSWYGEIYTESCRKTECRIWTEKLNNDIDKFPNFVSGFDFIETKKYIPSTKSYILSNDLRWYEKLDIVESVFQYSKELLKAQEYKQLADNLNNSFERLNFGYRCVNGLIEPTTSDIEIKAIETALKNKTSNISLHIDAALKYLSASQANPDYRNSVKESISAVEACCRSITNKNTLGDALTELEKQGIALHPQLKQGFSNLYNYTNDKKTGIRHALITTDYVPTADDAMFMLITCSAFINYVTKKLLLGKTAKWNLQI